MNLAAVKKTPPLLLPIRHMLSTLIDVPPETVWIGMPLEVVFHKMNEEITLPLFRPRA